MKNLPIIHFQKRILTCINLKTQTLFETGSEKLKAFPKTVLWLVYLMSVNVLWQGIADLVLKFGGYTPWIVQFPWRVDFLFLTAISVLMGYQTLIGIRRRELDVTRNSIQIGLVVELALLVGDIYFVQQNYGILDYVLPIRLPFMVLTFANILILLHVIKNLHLFTDQDGKYKWF